MKHSILFLFFTYFTLASFAQKPAIDSLAISKWKKLGYTTVLSSDGNYFLYTIDDYQSSPEILVIQSTSDNKWKKEFPGVSSGFFSGDNRKAVFQNKDSLFSSLWDRIIILP